MLGFIKNIILDIRSLLWFLFKGPAFYPSLIEYTRRKFLVNQDTDLLKKIAYDWCESNSIDLDTLLQNLGLPVRQSSIFEESFVSSKLHAIGLSNSDFGGGGHTDLLYELCEKLNAVNCIETGVAYGWSSEAILRSVSKRNGNLISVDMPMIGQSDYHLIGFVVSEKYKKRWNLIRKPDKNGLLEAIDAFRQEEIDLIHYDSDKSYYGRKWSQPIIYSALREGGYFISDDIEDNLAFKEFVEEAQINFFVTKYNDRFVGIIKK